MRVEFEFARVSLREFGLRGPDETLAAADELWAYATQSWLSLREPSDHSDRDRWPLSRDWEAVQKSALAGSSLPRARVEAGRTAGGLRLLMPLLNGCVASFASWIGVVTIADACARLPAHLSLDEQHSGTSFADRVADKIARRR